MISQGDLVQYGLLGLVLVLVLRRIIGGVIARRRIPALIREGATLIDVGSLAEFAAAHRGYAVARRASGC